MNRLLLLAISFLLTCNLSAQMTTRVVADNLFIPWEMVYGPDDHIWFTQKNGYICRLDPTTQRLDTLYNETNTVIQNEGGMLGMTLHPDFANSPYVYVAYNYTDNGYKERVVRYTYSGTVLQSPTTLIEGIDGTSIHNGCRLIIIDNKLYITTGDAANQSISQDVNALNGKTLRINLDGTIPSDNPISGSAVWSWGHRNAQGLAYANNRLYSSEHGPSNDDELNIIMKGRNYGWPTVQGYCNTTSEMTFCNDSNVVEPIEAWTPTLAVSGIAYYNHPMFPTLQNSILMTTLKDRDLYQLQLNNTFDDVTGSSTISIVSGDRFRAICVDPDGRIYISTSNSNASGTASFVDKIIEIYDPNYVPPSSIKTLDNNADVVSVYPNPVQNKIKGTIEQYNAKQDYSYSILSATGQVLQRGNIANQIFTIPVKELPSGVYIFKANKGSSTIKSMKLKKL